MSKGDEDAEKGYRETLKGDGKSLKYNIKDIGNLCSLAILWFWNIFSYFFYQLRMMTYYACPIHPRNTHITYNQNTPYLIGVCDVASHVQKFCLKNDAFVIYII